MLTNKNIIFGAIFLCIVILIVLYLTKVIKFGNNSKGDTPSKNVESTLDSPSSCNKSLTSSCPKNNHKSYCNDKYSVSTPPYCNSELRPVTKTDDNGNVYEGRCTEHNPKEGSPCINYYESSGDGKTNYKCKVTDNYKCEADKVNGLCTRRPTNGDSDSPKPSIKRNCKWLPGKWVSSSLKYAPPQCVAHEVC